jgi:ubiquinone/menaquinone biosynthesis C-methylase UbiE
VKLNLGSDMGRIDGFTNVDISEEANPDILCDVAKMPMIATASVEEIIASHILEHLPWNTEALLEWHRVLVPGGLITIATPDLDRAIHLLRTGYCSFAQFTAMVFGQSDTDLRAEYNHRQAFTEDVLLARVRPYFPDAVPTRKMPHRGPVPQECIVKGHKELP